MVLTFTRGRKYNYINPCENNSKNFPAPTSTKLIDFQQHNIQIITPIFIHILQNIWEPWIEIETALQSMAFIALILKKLSVIRFLWKRFVPNHIKFKYKHRKKSRKVNNDFTVPIFAKSKTHLNKITWRFSMQNITQVVLETWEIVVEKYLYLCENYKCHWVEFQENYTCSKAL